jgi:hypothetical protein
MTRGRLKLLLSCPQDFPLSTMVLSIFVMKHLNAFGLEVRLTNAKGRGVYGTSQNQPWISMGSHILQSSHPADQCSDID